MSFPPLLLPLFFTLALSIPDPNGATVQPISVHPSTIPAFPEQSAVAGCPLDLSDDFFNAVIPPCSSPDLHRSRCCPVLAAWLYSAYSSTALNRPPTTTTDMPLLPDDSETCVSDLSKALKLKGLHLFLPNDTCDLVSCYCGIRLHPFTCPDAFSLNLHGHFVVDDRVRSLETTCLTTSPSPSNAHQLPPLRACSNCLHSLYKVITTLFMFFLEIIVLCYWSLT